MASINGIYDISYFDAENNEYQIETPKIWWSSKHRFAVEDGRSTSEFLELDLGKRRSINYLSFDIIRKPIDVEIQYDAIDMESLDQYSSTPRWRSVKPINNEAFDSSLSYISDFVNPWQHCEFYFYDENNEPLVASKLRIKFTRRSDSWPTENFASFAWSIDAKNLRVGRFITEQKHIYNTPVEVNTYSGEAKLYSEARQQIIFDSGNTLQTSPTASLSNIDSFTPTKIQPKIAGFEFLTKPSSNDSTLSFNWEFIHIIGSIEKVLASGRKQHRISVDPQLSYDTQTFVVDHAWVRVIFDQPVDSEENGKYEIRIRNRSAQELESIYTLSPNPSSFDLKIANSEGSLENRTNTSLVYRLITDSGNYGKDLLGNEYREGARYSSADQSVDGKIYTNWTSAPNPSPDGVEALYLDIRKLVSGRYRPSVVDAIEINTLTPGVKMNVYYSMQETTRPPTSLEDWENMMWTPVRSSFKLNDKQTIDLPYPIMANWICIEFYNLQAYAFSVSNYPILPEVEYKEFPLWVYEGNPAPKPTNDQPILQRETFVDYTIPEVFVNEIENRNGPVRIYNDTPQTLQQNIAANGFGSADPENLARVSFSKNPFITPSVKRVDTTTTLGGFVYSQYTNTPEITYVAEAQQYPRIVENRSVSNANDRRLMARYDEINLLFNRVCAHQYAVKKGRFNKKAYRVSVSEIKFLRKDYSVEFDDPTINDTLVFEDAKTSLLIEDSSWIGEEKISIPIGSAVYVTYTVGETTYEDELITFEPATSTTPSFSPVELLGGGAIATSVIARSRAFKQGETYYRDQDFAIVYDPVTKKNRIKRHDIPARLVVPSLTHSVDRYTAIGAAIITTEIDPIELANGFETLRDLVELGDPDGVVTYASTSTMTGTITPPVTAESNGVTTIYATLTDPTG